MGGYTAHESHREDRMRLDPSRQRSFNGLAVWFALVLAGVLPSLFSPAVAQPPHPEVSDDRKAEVDALVYEGIRLRRAGQFPRSIEVLEQAIASARRSGYVEGEQSARGFLALTHKKAGNLETALELRKQNLALVRSHRTELLSGREHDGMVALAATYTSLGRYEEAIRLLQQAHTAESRDPISLGPPRTLLRLGMNFLLAGNLVEAEKALLPALAFYQKAEMARGTTAPGRPSSAVYEQHAELLRWVQLLRVAQNRTDEALELGEAARARALAELMAANPHVSRGSAALLTSPDLARIRRVAREQRSTLVHYSILYKYDPDAFMEFGSDQFAATDLLVWVIKPSGETSFRRVSLGKEALALPDLVRTARESIGARGRVPRAARVLSPPGRGRDQPDAGLRRLHALLIEPIAHFLPSDPSARVTFILQDTLFQVPFAALEDAKGKALIEKHTILLAPSVQILELAGERQRAIPDSIKGVLIVGNPTMPRLGSETLDALPSAEREAIEIAGLFKTKALVGARATKAATVSNIDQARVIHLATHGLLDGAGGALSSLALAPGAGDRGFLSAREIVVMKLGAELVVLSACDTGRGPITGDGVLGLSRAFLAAGASSIVVSLWAVPDETTVELMTAFYRSVLGGADKAQALRDSMLAIKKKFPVPLAWAGFALMGEPTVSAVLRDLRRGNPGALATAPDPRVTVTTPGGPPRSLPITDDAYDYRDYASSFVPGALDVTFNTRLDVPALVRFYRQTMAARDLSEDRVLAQENARGFQLVFHGSSSSWKIVIQGTAFRDDVTVSISYE